ncbi:methyltransferase-like protein 17, mitochondrial isoform X2 [Oncorhynchus tshawytscha]|uniref:methyltransferase-like protein 17, mitochondrial isoform X2 n=1 Tax=Oncorhynchus tshawytscha TaxID=74940 RepID=UPI000D09CD64|nr:methyltransferase-like protein 17, mitochondrial isoform X2 [Oncorhynchus tshawytscha]
MAFRAYGARVLYQRVVAVRIMYRALSAEVHPQSHADFLKGAPHRKHPGVTNLKTLRLPDELQKAAQAIIHGTEVSGLVDKARSLTNFLWSRKRAPEDVTLRERAMALEKNLWEKTKEKGGDLQLLKTQITKKVLSDLRKITYHWSPMRYDEELGVVYMVAKLAGGYAAVKRVLNEIKKRDPSFSPHSLLDFGSGLGTAVWASHSFWGDTLKEMVCVDNSGAMNTIADRLLRGSSEKDEPVIKQVYFRQFLPVSPKVQFDLVVGAFSLSELASQKEREDAILTLWRKTSSYLVLVENGTKEGHQILMDARDILLKKQERAAHDPRRPSVFAPVCYYTLLYMNHLIIHCLIRQFISPVFFCLLCFECPHESPCPKLFQLPLVPCNFSQAYSPLPLPGAPDRLTERFSYLVLSRTDWAGGEGLDWARLTAPVLRRPRHVHCQVCCSSGEIKRVVVTAHRHGRDVYRCARNSDWGDQLPIIQPEDDSSNLD